MVNKLKEYGTPRTPRSRIVKDNQQNMSKDDQTLYRSGVGMLLYLVEHSRPDIVNGVWELSKTRSGVTPKVMQEVKRMIKYVLDTKDLALKIKIILDIKGAWSMVAFSDSDYTTDPETRISISGYALYLMGGSADLVEIRVTEVCDIEHNGSSVHRDVRMCNRNQVCTSATKLNGYWAGLANRGVSW
jgi:hypothetical protein